MILSIGEILCDEMCDGEVRERFVGGAPFNFAVGAARAGANAGFVGSVGNDDAGGFLAKRAGGYGLKELYIARVEKPTTKAIVTLSAGERSFRFENVRGSFWDIDLKTATKAMDGADIVYLGTLMLALREGEEIFAKLIKTAKEKHKILSTDVNFRYDMYPSPAAAQAAIEKYLDSFDIVKFSDDELADFTGETDIDKAVKKLNPKYLLIVTMGKLGSVAYFKGEKIFAPCNGEVRPVDTTGAGDAFMGAAMAGIDGAGFDKLCADSLKSILFDANEAGKKAILHKGAL